MDTKEGQMKVANLLLITTIMALGTSEIVPIKKENNSAMKATGNIVRKSVKSLPFEYITIRENGIKRNIIVPINRNLSEIEAQSDIENRLNSKDGLLISFGDNNITLDAFETEFNLKLKATLIKGYYVFENNSSLNDIALMETILKWDESHLIKTIRPNWKMEMQTY